MPNLITRRDVLAAIILFVLPLILFAPVTLGSKTLLPVENRFTFEPYHTFAEDLQVGPPKNHLLSDLILENYVWKGFIREAISERELPLWNPYIFSGQPFLGNGQHSAMYPASLLFYILPLPKAYGWFTVLQLWLAGLFTYVFLRVLKADWYGALFGGIIFGLSTFMVNRVVFTMIIAAAIWLPLVLSAIEMVIRKQEEKGTVFYSPIPYLALGSVAMGLQVLAGHIEITIQVLLISAFYALCRLIMLSLSQQTLKPAIRLTAWLMAMMLVGLGLGAIQLIPFYEIGSSNFREGSASFAEVRGWALPYRRAISFLIPDFFGSPAHHGFFDLVSKQWQPLGLNAHGEVNPLCPNCTRWDTKNAVEAGAYPGVITFIVAGLVAIGWFGKRGLPDHSRRISFIFAGLAVVALLFIFGTPVYGLLYYGIPFLNQLHTPFRWIYAFTFSLAVLGGLGLSHLAVQSRLIKRLEWVLFGGGLIAIVGLAVVYLRPAPFISIAQLGFERSGLAQNAFANGQQFLSYLWPHLLAFFGFILLSGVWLWTSNRVSRQRWQWLAIIIIALDLIVANIDFNPATDPAPLSFTPPSIVWLQARQQETPYFRLSSYEGENNKLFDANTPMDVRLFDVRGYDSVIAKQYLEFMQLIQENGDWLHNRVGPIYDAWAGALDSALLDLLGVRYILTTQEINNPNYQLAYDAEIKIYENLDALPRAFFVSNALTRIDDLGHALRSLNPRETVILDGAFINSGRDLTPKDAQSPANVHQVTISRYENNQVILDAQVIDETWLVLADSYFPGWKAYARPNIDDPDNISDEIEITIHRANGNFRAVKLPPGSWQVRFVYTPMSFKLGAYTSFLAGMVLVLAVAYWLWGKVYREQASDSIIKRVAKNSLAPMVLALMNRAIDFVFALLVLRILAPEGVGRYAFAVALVTLFEILTRFGLGTLLTREVSKDHASANKYLFNTIVVRNILGLIAIPIMAAILALYYLFDDLTADVVYTVMLFTVGLFLSNIADALSALFYAYEKAEYPAFIATMTALMRIAVGAFLLLLGFGIVGLGAASVIGNLLSVVILGTILIQKIFKPQIEMNRGLQHEMVRESFPLMINHLLSTIFFRVDVFILKPTWGDQAVGYYNAAYKYVDGINVIPQYFTLAIFPLMSRYADTSRESLIRAYLLSLRLLQMLAIPIAVGTPFIADDLILILGGQAFLPDAAIVLQILIWFLPFSFINQVTQYVLIAIDQQRFLTKAFIIGVTFNVVSNLILVPLYGYRAAAITTILSEWSLLIPFYYAIHKNLCVVPWFDVVWRPTIAAVVMGIVLWGLRDWGTLVMLPVGALVYLVVLGIIKGYQQPDMDLIWQALPLGRLARFVPR
ncbi:MAG: oligosaccharide flippase family protein [Chloroflexota bacterium]